MTGRDVSVTLDEQDHNAVDWETVRRAQPSLLEAEARKARCRLVYLRSQRESLREKMRRNLREVKICQRLIDRADAAREEGEP